MEEETELELQEEFFKEQERLYREEKIMKSLEEE